MTKSSRKCAGTKDRSRRLLLPKQHRYVLNYSARTLLYRQVYPSKLHRANPAAGKDAQQNLTLLFFLASLINKKVHHWASFMYYYNALANITQSLIGQGKNFVKIYSAIFSRYSSVVSNFACEWSTLWFYITHTANILQKISCFSYVKV